MHNRVTSDSNSDAVFASCTILPIYQTTLNVEEMADIDGLGSVTDAIDAAIDYVSDVVDKIGDSVSDFVDSLYFYPQDAEPQYKTNSFAPPPPDTTMNIITREVHKCDGPYVYSSYGICLCPSEGPP